MGNARFYGTGVMLLFSSFQRVSVPYEAKESGSGQSGCADFEYDMSILIKDVFQWCTMKIILLKGITLSRTVQNSA